MKNLSQFPRKISAKFCYQKKGPDNFDVTETQTESVPRKNERVEPVVKNIDIQNSLNELQQQITEARFKELKKRDEQELLAAKKALEALREVPGKEAVVAQLDFAAEVPVKPNKSDGGWLDNVKESFISLFARNKELREDYDNAPANTIANIENDEKFPGIIGSSQIEDYDIAA